MVIHFVTDLEYLISLPQITAWTSTETADEVIMSRSNNCMKIENSHEIPSLYLCHTVRSAWVRRNKEKSSFHYHRVVLSAILGQVRKGCDDNRL